MVNLGETTMDRRQNSFTANGPKVGLIVSTALASIALTGCAASAPPAEVSFNKAQSALEDGRLDRAIAYAEEAVLADPRNASFRALLGAAYLEGGRFQSAATSFNDALELGDTDPRTVLSYALAATALGDNDSAVEKLNEYENLIPAADLGLAFALAGQPERGVYVLVNSVRNGNTSAKTRQNLAYSYALAGNWRAARVMAAEDVPADQLDARLTEWASSARPEAYQERVAGLLGVSPAYDGGQPRYLALSNFPTHQQMVADAAAQVQSEEPVAVAVAPAAENSVSSQVYGIEDIDTIAVAAANEGAPSEDSKPSIAVAEVEVAPEPAPVAAPSPAPTTSPSRAVAARSAPAPRFVSNPVVQDVSNASAREPQRANRSPQRRMAVASSGSDTHMVQLGSFDSRAVAESKWDEMQRRFPELADRDVVITEAEVNGRTFFRVATGGFGLRSARRMCDTVKSAGRDCFAYAAASPPAGVVDRSVRLASRGR